MTFPQCNVETNEGDPSERFDVVTPSGSVERYSATTRGGGTPSRSWA